MLERSDYGRDVRDRQLVRRLDATLAGLYNLFAHGEARLRRHARGE
jgi:hypothetical protein